MDHLRGIRLFTRVVEAGSFAGAAKVEDVAQSTVSKEVAALEGHLATQLIRRSSRGLSITETGREYYDFAVGMLADLDAVEARVRSGNSAPRGRIRVAVPLVLSSRFIIPHLGGFLDRYPELTLDVEASEQYVNLIEDGIDLAIRIGAQRDSSLMSRQIGVLEPEVVASPAYLDAHGVPRHPDDLRRHICLPFMFEGSSKAWRFRDGDGEIRMTPTARLRTNDADGVHAAVRAGLGIAQGPSWMFAEDVAAGALVPLLADYTPSLVPIRAITSANRRMTGAIQLLVDHLAAMIREEPHLRMR